MLGTGLKGRYVRAFVSRVLNLLYNLASLLRRYSFIVIEVLTGLNENLREECRLNPSFQTSSFEKLAQVSRTSQVRVDLTIGPRRTQMTHWRCPDDESEAVTL